jgi:Cohesin domain
MKFIYLQKYLQVVLIPVILVLMWGCGSGGGTSPNQVVSKVATVSVTPSGNGEYVIQGDNMDGVAGIDLTISYDSSTLSSPTVAQGGLISGAFMVSNTTTPGTVRIGFIIAYPKVFSGSGQLATVSFAAVTGEGSVSVASVNMVDVKGAPIP